MAKKGGREKIKLVFNSWNWFLLYHYQKQTYYSGQAGIQQI